MRCYVYGDESGDFNFSNHEEASQFFILTTVTVLNHTIEDHLMELRRELAWESWHDVRLTNSFHAKDDNRHVRRRVFAALIPHEFRIDATIFEKRKADPRIRATDARFYGFAWYYHLASLIPALAPSSEEILVIAADIGKGKNDKRSNFDSALGNMASAVGPSTNLKGDMWSASSAPLLQAADYCSWAIQRKWERRSPDTNAYDLMRDKVASEFDFFRTGTVAYY